MFVGREVYVSTLAGQRRKMIQGEFRFPETHESTNRNGRPTLYEAISDRHRIRWDIGQPITKACEVVVHTLSRDECEVFPDPKQVAFKGGPQNPVQPDSTLSWWHISTQDSIKDQVESQYSRILTDMGKNDRILDVIPLATTPVFTHHYSRAYRCRPQVPQARYHCGINQMIASYKSLLHINDVEFRVHGTTEFLMEVMYSILICPKGSKQLDAKFPRIKVRPFSERGQHKKDSVPSPANIVSIERNEYGEYRVIWRPFCTRYQRDRSLKWDNLTFAFVLPQKIGQGHQRLPLPVPHRRQDKLHRDPGNTGFGRVIEVTHDDDSACSEDTDTISSEESDINDNEINKHSDADSDISNEDSDTNQTIDDDSDYIEESQASSADSCISSQDSDVSNNTSTINSGVSDDDSDMNEDSQAGNNDSDFNYEDSDVTYGNDGVSDSDTIGYSDHNSHASYEEDISDSDTIENSSEDGAVSDDDSNMNEDNYTSDNDSDITYQESVTYVEDEVSDSDTIGNSDHNSDVSYEDDISDSDTVDNSDTSNAISDTDISGYVSDISSNSDISEDSFQRRRRWAV